MTAVRDARDGEDREVADLLSRVAFGPNVARLIAAPRASPHGDVLVAEGRRGLIGAVCCLSFGHTGWIGALGVVQRSRGRGVGTELTEAAIERLRTRGARTILLYATDLGRPVYERLGFATDGSVSAWRGSAGVAPETVEIRRLGDADRPAMLALDRGATGEDRQTFLDGLVPLSGLVAERHGAVRGWAAGSQYGSGVAICADDLDAGVALMAAVGNGPGATVVLPDANTDATAVLRRWGMQPTGAGERMSLGRPVAWRPERQFGLFNLFWG